MGIFGLPRLWFKEHKSSFQLTKSSLQSKKLDSEAGGKDKANSSGEIWLRMNKSSWEVSFGSFGLWSFWCKGKNKFQLNACLYELYFPSNSCWMKLSSSRLRIWCLNFVRDKYELQFLENHASVACFWTKNCHSNCPREKKRFRLRFWLEKSY